ncbi:APH domain-containing protein [Balamuthia mandrillaris]
MSSSTGGAGSERMWAAVPCRISSALATTGSGSTFTPMPSASELLKWTQSFLPYEEARSELKCVEVSGKGLGGGLNGSMFRLHLTWADDGSTSSDNVPESPTLRPHSFVVKTLAPDFTKRLSSILLGSAREAHFYHGFASYQAPRALGSVSECAAVRSVVPRIYHAEGSYFTGDYVLVMEDLSHREACLGSHVLGNQCWGPVKNFPKLLQTEEVGVQMLEEVFVAMADVHAAFWRDEKLLEHSWLKAADWLKGRDRARWELAVEGMRRKWRTLLESIQQKKTSVKWSETVIRSIEDSLAATSWESFRQSFDVTSANTPFTLCHGDFHAANILWVPDEKQPRGSNENVYMVDWSEVGIFCPFTDIAQFMISNATIKLRRKHEHRIFKGYHRRLVEKGICEHTFPLEECWERYKRGGIERWLQMLIYMAQIGLPDPSVAWFHDQVAAFIEDHNPKHMMKVPLMSSYVLAM